MSTRRFGEWSGNPRGIAEDVTRCIKDVPQGGWGGWASKQCSRPRGFGKDNLYCRQHAKGHYTLHQQELPPKGKLL